MNPTWIRCDGLLCDEKHPVEHELLGEPGFAPGRWAGWIYVDLNRPDVMQRDLRFCSGLCLERWMEELRDRSYTTRMDAYLAKLDTTRRAESRLQLLPEVSP